MWRFATPWEYLAAPVTQNKSLGFKVYDESTVLSITRLGKALSLWLTGIHWLLQVDLLWESKI